VTLLGSQWVMLSTGRGFSPPADWSNGPFIGTEATLLGDIDGDGRADLVAVNHDDTWVMLSTPHEELHPEPFFHFSEQWSGVPFSGRKATLLGDINGDGRADLVAVNAEDTWVMLSNGSGFADPVPWSGVPFFGRKATLLGDIDGDGRADLVAVNEGDAWVMLSTGSGFSEPTRWSGVPFFGSKATLLGDVSGDGRADLVAVNDDDTWVMLSTGSGFSEPTQWSDVPFFGNVAILLGAVDGSPRAAPVAVGVHDYNPPTDDPDDTGFQDPDFGDDDSFREVPRRRTRP
jgi:VCBS repeat protein